MSETVDDGEFEAVPRSPFYIVADGGGDVLDIDSEGKTPMAFDVAVDVATNFVNDNGGEWFVIECRCIRKVSRGPLRVTEVKQTKAAKR